MFTVLRNDGWRPSLEKSQPGADGLKPSRGEDIKSFHQAAAPEVEYMVVGQHTHVRPNGGQRLDVCRIHPVVDGLAWDIVVTGGDAGLDVDDQSTGCGMLLFALMARST